MRNRAMKRTSYLALLLLMLQLFLPIASGFAATNSSILPPSNLAVQQVTPDDVKLTWSSVYGATGYNVYEIKEGQLLLLGKVTTTSYNLNNLDEGSYRYVVSTLSTEGESGPCAPITVDIVYPDLVAPATFTYTIQKGNDIVLNWGASQYAQSYNIYQISADGQKTLLTSVTSRTYTISNAPAGNYTYSVSAVNSMYGESPLSTALQVEVVYPTMKAPSNFTYTVANGNDVTLKWDTVPYATNYKIYQIIDGQPVLKDTVTTNTVKYTNVASGDYVYEIHSNSDRFGESAEGSKLSVTVSNITMSAPSNFSYKIQNTNDIVLTWGSVPYATGYKVYQIIDGEKILKSSVTGTSVSYTKVPAGNYVYEVYSYSDRFGESADGSQVSLTIDAVVMDPPGNLTYKIQNGNDIALSWEGVSNATSYKVYQIIDGQKVLKSTVTGTTATYTNMPAGNYVYEVYSYSDRFGESVKGSQVSLTVDSITMSAPGNFSYKIQNGNDITLSWDSVSNATNYKVYQIVNGQKVLKSTVTGTTVTYANMPEGDYKYEVTSFSTRFGESNEGSQLSFSLIHPTMQPPSNLIQTVTSDTSFTLSWDASPYATSYKVYQIINGEKVLKSTVTGTSISYSNMASGEYNYVVHSYSSRFGESMLGTSLTFNLIGKTMQAPTNLAYTIQNGNDISLTWTAAQYATGYNIYQVIDGVKVFKSKVTGTSALYTNLPGGNYKYIVHSTSSLFGESVEGAEVSIPLVLPTVEAPNNFTYKIQNENDIVLNWDAVDYANSYKVYEVIDGQKVLKSTVSGLTTTFSKVPEGEHIYEVHAVSTRFGESSEGSKLSITIDAYILKAPANLTYKIQNENDIVLNWEAVDYANSYKVYEVVDGQKVLKSTVSTLTTIFSKVPAGEHIYEVHTVSTRFGESTEGSKLSITINPYILQAPANLTYKVQNGNDVVLTWEAPQYANSYKVYELVDGQKVLKSTVTSLSATLTNVPAGDHTYEVHTVSTRFGESLEGSKVSFTMNEYNIQAPKNVTYKIQNGNDVVLTWEAPQYANSYKVYELVDGQKVLKSTVTSLSATITNVAAGDHTYVVHAYSNRFGESPEGSQVNLNLVFPIMQAPGNLTKSITNGNDITLNWSAVTYATAYKVYQIINGEPVLKKTVTSRSITFTNMPEGEYKYEIHAFSTRFGESPEGSQIDFELVFPIMQAPGNLTKSITNGNDITLKWNAVTYATAYKVYQIINGEPVLKKTVTGTSVSFINMPEGDYKYEVHSYSDRFGESEASTLNFQLAWPVLQPPQLTGTVFNANNITLSWKAAPWANEYRVYKITGNNRELIYKGTALSYKVYNLTEDTHSFEVTIYNTRFGESEPSNRITENIVYPVMQPPVANLKLLSDSSALIYWDFVTYTNGYNIYELVDGKPILIAEKVNNLSYTVSNLSYANHEYFVTAYSNSFGESEPSNTVLAKLIVDTEAPVTTIDAPSDWTNQKTVVTLSAKDNETGVANTYYSINDSDFVAGTTFTIEGEGVHKVSFYSVDKVGNKESIQTVDIKIDQTAPVTKINESSSWSNQSVTLNINATDVQSGVAKTYYSINGSEYNEGTSVTIEKEGINKVSFYSVDQAGNIEKAQTTEVKIDKTAPVTKSDAPQSWSKENVAVNLTAEDSQSGVAKTYYSINGSEYVEGTSVTIEKEGINKVSFYSVDQAGNIEKAQTTEVKIDKTAPIITMDLNEEYKLGSSIPLLYAATDDLSGIVSEQMIVYGPNDTLGKVVANGSDFTIDKPGIYSVIVTATNGAGLTTTIEKKFVVYIPATIEVTPKVIKGNNGVFTVRVDLPNGYSSQDFDLKTATLNGVSALISNNGYFNQAKIGQFKFERSDFTWTPSEVTVQFRCYLDGNLVVGQTTVKVQK